MDLRVFYRKVREVVESIPDEFTIVISEETPDGGKAGVPAEVRRGLAAKLVVDGKARLATPEEIRQYWEDVQAARQQADRDAVASRLQVAVVTEESIALLGREKKSKKSQE